MSRRAEGVGLVVSLRGCHMTFTRPVGVSVCGVGCVGDMAALLRSLFIKSPPSGKLYEPSPRAFHYVASVGGQCYVIGGCPGPEARGNEVKFLSTVEVFDPHLEQWRTQEVVAGSAPKEMYAGACCVSPSGDLYVYGGMDTNYAWHGELHKLDSGSLSWIQLTEESDASGPMKKNACGLVFVGQHQLVIIGGYGVPHGPTQPGSSFIKNTKSTSGSGWTNEIHVFDLEGGMCS